MKRRTQGQRAAFGWSGGKDSLVLAKIMEMADVTECILAVSNLEYPAFIEWVEKNRPKKLEIINTGQDIGWLARNEHMLFPQDGKTAAKWFRIVQHTGQRMYFKKHGLDILALGRRKIDGNYTGGRGETEYTDRNGVRRYCPLAYWSHEAIFAFIAHYRIELPPIYSWRNGFRVGTGPWPARQWTGSTENGWKEVFEIEPSIVHGAAEHIGSAKDFLRRTDGQTSA